MNCMGGEVPSFPDEKWDKEKSKLFNEIKSSVKTISRGITKENSTVHLNTLFKQGEFLKLAQKEQKDPIWKSFIWNLKSGTAKFLLNATIHTLPTMNNLKMWNKSVTDQCHLCHNRDSTLHTLNGCKVALDQGRFTYRHDNIINFIVSQVDKKLYKVYSDLDGHMTSNGGTIPPSMAVTSLKPDIVIVDELKKTVNIFELTVPFEGNIKTRNMQKNNKYAHFVTDIKSHKATVTAFEVGLWGYITEDNEKNLKKLFTFCEKKITSKKFLESISTLSITSSYLIFTSRKQPTWSSPGFMSA